MAVMQMQRISICALKENRKAILEKLQALGVMEIDTTVLQDEDLQKMDTSSNRQVFEKQAVMADHALEVLDTYAPEKKSMLSSLEGKPLIGQPEFHHSIELRGQILQDAKNLTEWSRKISEKQAAIQKLENQAESMTPWLALDIPMAGENTEQTVSFIGTLPGALTKESIHQMVSEQNEQLEAFDVKVLYTDRDTTYLAVTALQSEAAAVEEALRRFGFARPSYLANRTPAQEKAGYEKKIGRLKEQVEELKEKIRACAGSRRKLQEISDYYRIRSDKYEVLGQIPQSQNTFFVSGFVPADSLNLIKEKIGDVYDCSIDIEDVPEEVEAPVLLKNGPISSTTEGVLASFGLPKKGEIDPTTIMSAFYIFLFGMMLSDAGYGLIMFLGCFIAIRKFPRMGESMKKTLQMFMYCGISTIIWGVLFGGFFGDVVNVVSRVFFGHEVGIPPLWFAPLNDPMKLLMFSLAVGLVHLFTGLFLKGYTSIKNGDVMSAVIDCGCWFLFLIGLILMLLPSSIFAGIAGTQIVFPPFVNLLAKVLTIVGALGLLLFSARDKKNPGLRLALGAYELYGVTSWLSDVLSYSRLLALGLATGVIAQVINQIGSMGGRSILGAILFIIVFLVGHTLSLAINLLGAYVHTNRLQYVEFFGKFYEGGGRPFSPFRANTKYVDIKED